MIAFCRVWICGLALLLSACGGGGGASATLPASTPQPVQLSLKSVDVSSPAPLSLIHLTTSGLASSGSVTVTFADSQSYSVTLPAIAVSTAGVVSVGVPIYIRNSLPSAGAVQVKVTQGGLSTNAIALSVQSLPSLSTYGVTPGQISSAFMTFSTLIHAIRLSELQVVQSEEPGLANISSAVSTVSALLGGAITTRNAIATVMAGGTVPIGTDSSGGAVQLDPTQLALMDQVIVAALQQIVPSVPVITNLKRAAVRSQLRGPRVRIKATANPAAWWSALNTVLTTSNGAYTIRADMQGQDSSVGSIQADQAAAEGAASLSGAADSPLIGIPLAFTHLYATLDSTFHTIGAAAACIASVGCGTQVAGEIQGQLANDESDMGSTVWSTIASLDPLTASGGVIVSAGSGLGTFLQNVQSLVSSGKVAGADAVDNAVLNGSTGVSAGLIDSALPSSQPDSVQYCCFAGGSVVGVTDAAGDYELWMPAGVGGTSYSNIQLSASDPATGVAIASDTESVNLTALDQVASNVAGLSGGLPGGLPGGATAYTLSGSYTLTGTGTTTPVAGCTAATATSSAQGIVNATVNGNLQTAGTYTANVSMGSLTVTTTVSSTTCTSGGQTITVPGQTSTATVPAATSSVSVVSDGTHLTISGPLLGTDPSGCTGGSSATGTVTGLSNPLVSLSSAMTCTIANAGTASETATIKMVGSW